MKALPTRLPKLLALALVLAGCQDTILTPDGDVGSIEMAFDVSGALAAGFSVDEAVITFHRDDFAEPVVVTVPLSEGSAVVEAVLRPGRWGILVELFDAGDLAGTGTGSALVRPGFVTEVDIEIEPGTGGVRVNVRWAEDFIGTIADLSDRPVLAEIEGVGTFEVHGLSRIGWDIEVLESPTTGGRSHKDAGAYSYPDFVMLDLTASLEEVEALAAWIEGPENRRALTVDLLGLGGEYARVAIYEVGPVDGNTSITPAAGPLDRYTLAGVRLSVSTDMLSIGTAFSFMEPIDYTPLDPYPPCPTPGKAIEISGVTSAPPSSPCYPEGVLHVPAAGSSDPLYLPALRDGLAAYTWARNVLLDVQALGCATCGLVGSTSMSVISLDADGLEIGRVNMFEVWPSSFTFFDPELEYGHGYLFGTNIVNNAVEDA